MNKIDGSNTLMTNNHKAYYMNIMCDDVSYIEFLLFWHSNKTFCSKRYRNQELPSADDPNLVPAVTINTAHVYIFYIMDMQYDYRFFCYTPAAARTGYLCLERLTIPFKSKERSHLARFLDTLRA